MKQEIYQGGRLKMTIQSTDGAACDLVMMPKMIAKECSMTAKGFDELFFCFLDQNVTHAQAYEKAEMVHENYFGRRKYSAFESFKAYKHQRLSKK